MDTFNLNSDSYTEHEIKELLNLKEIYDLNDINKATLVLRQQLKTTVNLNVEKQREILFFIDTISNRIVNALEKSKNSITYPYENTLITQGNNFIIDTPDSIAGKRADHTGGRLTFESNTSPPGYINPINVRTITQAISIDSRFRPNYYSTKSTNFDVILPAIQKNVVSMRIATIELPLTYYAISQTQGNATCLIINLAVPTTCWILNLPDGNYEQSWADNSKAEHIEKAMTSAISHARPATIDSNGKVTPSTTGTMISTTTDLSYLLDRISGRSIFSTIVGTQLLTAGFIIRFNVDNTGSLNVDTSIQLRLGWQIGFRCAEYVCNIIAPSTSSSCISEGICLIVGPRYCFISIDDYQRNTGPAYIVAYGNSILQNNIITRINLAALQTDVGIYQSSSDPGLTNQLNRTREYFGPVDIQKLHISLYDEYGRIIDLNNMDWSLSLTFDILYN
jgi:hypothetical protein